MFKVKAVLRLTEKDHLENIEEHIQVVDSPYLPKTNNGSKHIQNILAAIADKALINITYLADDQRSSKRNIEPVGIFYMGRYWYLIAYCRLRNDYRNFRVERIKTLSTTDGHFKKQHPSLKSFLTKTSKEKELHTIIIKIDKEVVKYLGEQKFYNGYVSQKEIGDSIEMTFLTESLTGFARWFLLFGDHAEIVTPVTLKAMVKETLTAISKKLK
jgi:predicted DNA-binding transcriptional regulator YafY